MTLTFAPDMYVLPNRVFNTGLYGISVIAFSLPILAWAMSRFLGSCLKECYEGFKNKCCTCRSCCCTACCCCLCRCSGPYHEKETQTISESEAIRPEAEQAQSQHSLKEDYVEIIGRVNHAQTYCDAQCRCCKKIQRKFCCQDYDCLDSIYKLALQLFFISDPYNDLVYLLAAPFSSLWIYGLCWGFFIFPILHNMIVLCLNLKDVPYGVLFVVFFKRFQWLIMD